MVVFPTPGGPIINRALFLFILALMDLYFSPSFFFFLSSSVAFNCLLILLSIFLYFVKDLMNLIKFCLTSFMPAMSFNDFGLYFSTHGMFVEFPRLDMFIPPSQ